MGKETVITPPTGKETGIYSDMIEIIRKNSMGIHISETTGTLGSNIIKSMIDTNETNEINIFNL